MSGAKTTTQENKTINPMAQQYGGDIMSQAQRLYQSGAGTKLWGGPQNAPLNPFMQQALGGMWGMANRMGGGGGSFPGFGGGFGGGAGYPPPWAGSSWGSPPKPTGDFGPGGNVAPQPGGPNDGISRTMALSSARGPDTSMGGINTPGMWGDQSAKSSGPQDAPGGPNDGLSRPMNYSEGGLGNPAMWGDPGAARGPESAMGGGYPGGMDAAFGNFGSSMGPGGSSSLGGPEGFGQSSMPWMYGLEQMGNNGLTPQMQQQLGYLDQVGSGQDSINTGGLFGGLYGRSLNQNRGANGVMGQIAGGNPINTEGAFGDVAGRARGMNGDIIGGMGGIAGGSEGIRAGSYLQDLFNSTRGQNADAEGVFGGIASGQNGVGTGGQFRSVSDSAAGPTASTQYLTDLAKGGGVNPFLQKMLDDNANRVTNRVNSSMSGAGRVGSFAHGDALARSIGEVNNPVLERAYESDQNRRIGAAGQIDASRRGADATRLAGIAGETGVAGQNIGNQMGAAGNLAGLRNADTGMGAGLLGQIGGFENQNIGNRLGASNLIGGLRNQNIGNELNALGGQTNAQGQNAGMRLNAANSLAGSNRADVAGAMGAAQGLTGVQGQNIANRMSAANSSLGAQQGGANTALGWGGLAGQNNNLAYDPMMRQMGIGNYMQGRDQSELDNQRDMWNQANQMPWTQLGRYGQMTNPMLQGLLANATNKNTTQQGPGFGWQQGIGLGMAGLGMAMGNPFAGMGMMGGMGGMKPSGFGGW